MEKRHKTAQLICILTGIIALWSELIWPSSLWPTFLPGSAVTHGAQGQRFSSHWWLEWHAQTSRTICGDCRSSASPAIVGFCHGKHYASTMRLLQSIHSPTLQELSCQGPGPPVRCNCLGCHSCKWCMVCQSINGLYEKMYRFKKMRISIFLWGLQVK